MNEGINFFGVCSFFIFILVKKNLDYGRHIPIQGQGEPPTALRICNAICVKPTDCGIPDLNQCEWKV
jgi:hypothetical protein